VRLAMTRVEGHVIFISAVRGRIFAWHCAINIPCLQGIAKKSIMLASLYLYLEQDHYTVIFIFLLLGTVYVQHNLPVLKFVSVSCLCIETCILNLYFLPTVPLGELGIRHAWSC
jgi:hypothetical protein